MQEKFKATAEMKDLLRKSGSRNQNEALAAQLEIAKALEIPLRQAILSGNIIADIFEPIMLDTNSTSEFPLHFLSPGTEKEHVAYALTGPGRIPQRHIEGDYVMVPTYSVGSAIDWSLKYARDARWDIVSEANKVLEAGFVKKLNDDGWRTLITAGYDRNVMVVDSDATAGQFTKRLVSLAKVVMRRNGGGNSSSVNRSKLTDLYLSPEAMEDIRNWNVDQIDEVTRREIYVAADDGINRVFNVNLHTIDELGEGQEYQLFYTSDLGATIPASKLELAVGLDLSASAFKMPVRAEVELFPDPTLHREQQAGLYGWAEQGFFSSDGRKVLLMAL